MDKITDLIERMRQAPKSVAYADLHKVCDHHFGKARQEGTSHRVYKTPWHGDPRVNIQKGDAGKAQPCQVRQASKKLEAK